MNNSNRKVREKASNAGKVKGSINSNLGLHFNLRNGDIPYHLILRMLEFLDNSLNTNLQLQLMSKRWYLTATDSMQDVWHSLLFRVHKHLPEQLLSEKFGRLKNAKFFIGRAKEDDNEFSPSPFRSPMPSKHNQLEYLCFEKVYDHYGITGMEDEQIIKNVINTQE